MTFGERLTLLRKEKKLTQEEIAKKLLSTRSTYAQYEVGRRVPEYATLEKLADFFDVSIDYLVCRTDERKPKKELNKVEPSNVNGIILNEIVNKYNLDLTIPGNKEKLEKIIQIVVDDFDKKST